MTAKVSTLVSTIFVPKQLDSYSVQEINDMFESIEKSFNYILNKIREQGFYMDDMKLKRVSSIVDMATVSNENIDSINEYISSMNNALAGDYFLSKEILEVSQISLRNETFSASVSVQPKVVSVALSSGEVVTVGTTGVVIQNGTDSKEILYD